MDTKNLDVQEWAEKDARYVWHAMSRLSPGSKQTWPGMIVTEGHGAWISDMEGNRYLDGMSGLWCVNVGYDREELARAAYEQLQKLPYYPLTMSHRPVLQLWFGGQRGSLQDGPPVPRAERPTEPMEVRISLLRLPRQLDGLSRGCYELAQEWLANAENGGPTVNSANRGIRILVRFSTKFITPSSRDRASPT
jgi:hypothetical protein